MCRVSCNARTRPRPLGARAVAFRRVDERGDLADQSAAFDVRLAPFDVAIRFPDEVIGRLVGDAARVQLIADAAGDALAQREAAFVFQGRLGRQPAEVRPTMCESAPCA